MTTVCIDKDGNMAADSQVSEGSLIVSNNFEKIRKFKSKEMGQVYVGIAGALSHAVELFEYIESVFNGDINDSEEPLKFISDCLQVLLLDEDGDVYGAEFTESSKGVHWVPLDKPASIGSGSHLCLGALEAGLNAHDAIKVAALRDCFTNDNIKSYSYKDLAYDHIIDERIVELKEELEVLLKSREEELSEAQGIHTNISKLAQEIDHKSIDMEEAHDLIEEVLEELKVEQEDNPWIPWEAKADSEMPDWLVGDEYLELQLRDGSNRTNILANKCTWSICYYAITAYRLYKGTK